MTEIGAIVPASVRAKIDEMVRRIVERFHPEKVILFGSYARGSAGPVSDVDLLVVMPYEGPKPKTVQEIHRTLAGMGIAKDVVVVAPEYFERFRNIVGTIAYPAAQEGRILYERPS